MAQQTIPKGARAPAGARVLRGALDSSSTCVSSQCAVEVDEGVGTGAVPPPPQATPPAPNPMLPPMEPVPQTPVPRLYNQMPEIETGTFTKCDLGICGPVTSAGQVAIMGDSTTGTIQAVPSNSFWARQMFAVANGDNRSLTEQNRDWNNQAMTSMGQDQGFIDYAETLRPVFGDAAYAVARANMAGANGLGAGYSDSSFFTPDNTARHGMAGALQTAGLAGNDTGLAEAAYAVDPSAFNGTLLRVNPMTGDTYMETLGGISDGYNQANVNDVLAANYGGAQGYLGRVSTAEKAQADQRKVQAAGDAKVTVAGVRADADVARAKINAGSREAVAVLRASRAGAAKQSAIETMNVKIAELQAKHALAEQARKAEHERLKERNAHREALRRGEAAPSTAPVIRPY